MTKMYKSKLGSLSIRKDDTSFQKTKICCAKDSAAYIRQFYHDDIEIFESMFLVLLNRANTTEAYAKISQGGTAGTVVDVKIIAKYAVDVLASGVILCHNHPSGNINPSEEDIKITQKVKNALNLLDIKLLDHIILTKESYYSFADERIL